MDKITIHRYAVHDGISPDDPIGMFSMNFQCIQCNTNTSGKHHYHYYRVLFDLSRIFVIEVAVGFDKYFV